MVVVVVVVVVVMTGVVCGVFYLPVVTVDDGTCLFGGCHEENKSKKQDNSRSHPAFN